MPKRAIEKEKSTGSSRRSLLKTATLAAVTMMLDPLLEAQPGRPPVDYGKGAGQTHLDSTNLFPLLAAWVLLTTNGPAETTDVATIASASNISSASAQIIFKKFTDHRQEFSTVRTAFGELATAFATAPPYSGGQCPERAATITPIASLLGPTPSPARTRKRAK